MSTVEKTNSKHAPATVAELLDREEALAIQQLTISVQRLADDVIVASELRERIRRHPLVAAGLGGLLGFLGSPLILRSVKRGLTASFIVRNAMSKQPHALLPDFFMTSLRAVRARL